MINIILVGESCSGKSETLSYFVDEHGFMAISTYTDRPPRKIEDPHYRFVSEESFSREGEYDEITVFDNYHYGKKDSDLNTTTNTIAIVDLNGISYLRKIPNSRVVYICAQADIRLARLLRRYEDNKKKAWKRFAHDRKAFAGVREVAAHVVHNNHSLQELFSGCEQLIEKNNEGVYKWR